MFKIIGADQKQYGPISDAQIRQWIADGRLNQHSQAQREGSIEWQPLGTFPEFADIFNPVPPASPAPGFTPPPMSSGAPTGVPPSPGMTNPAAAEAVKGPAIALMVTAGLSIALDLLGMLGNLAGFNQQRYENMPNLSPQMRSILLHFQGGAGVLINLFGIGLSVFVLLGALKMMRLQSFNFVLAACIVAMIPCTGCCCILGIPFGIWALVVINKPEIKSQFS